jgi:hypothetical protein
LADDQPASAAPSVSDQAKEVGEAVKQDAKAIAGAATEGAKQVAVAAKEVAHEVSAAAKEGAQQVAGAAKSTAEKTKAAVKPDHKPDPKPDQTPSRPSNKRNALRKPCRDSPSPSPPSLSLRCWQRRRSPRRPPTRAEARTLGEQDVLKMVIDGKDMADQMAEIMAKRDQMMAALPPDQRARVEAMFKSNGMPQVSDGRFRICISPAMAKRDTPVIDKDAHCQPAKLTHNGNQSSFEMNCTSNGVTAVGKGTRTVAGDVITTEVDMTTTQRECERQDSSHPQRNGNALHRARLRRCETTRRAGAVAELSEAGALPGQFLVHCPDVQPVQRLVALQ